MTDTLQLGKRITRWRQKFVLHRVNSCVVFKQMFLDKHTLRFFAKKKPTCAGCLQQSQRWPFWRFKSGGLFFCVSYVCVRSTTNVHNYVISCNMSDMTEWFGHACNCDVTVTALIYTMVTPTSQRCRWDWLHARHPRWDKCAVCFKPVSYLYGVLQ